MTAENPTTGGGETRTDWTLSGLPLPSGATLLSFDSSLRVGELAAGSRRAPRGLEGAPLSEAIGASDPSALERAARRALEGRTATVACSPVGSTRELMINLAPHPHRPGWGLALLFDAPGRPPGHDADRDRAEELELISAAARELARSTHSDEARSTLCEAAQSVCTAEVVILFEPDDAGRALVATASRGIDAEGAELPLGESSAAAMAMRTNAPCFRAEPTGEPARAAAFIRDAGLNSILWQPVSRGRTVRAVLAVSWRSRVSSVHERTARLLEFVSVEGAVAIDRGSAFGRLVTMARSDPLTGLDNRRAWSEELDRELARARRESTPLAVALLDLDYFKAYNDTHGHPAGDRLLEQLARAWLDELRATDVLARYGGDEFALALPKCDQETAWQTLQRLRRRSDGGSFSAGVVEWDGSEDVERLIARADLALYEAKAGGAGKIHVG